MYVNNRDAVSLIARREPFKNSTGSFRGQEFFSTFGALPREFEDELWATRNEGRLTYVVMSYLTPIAWHDSDLGWVVPDVRYSNTTSRHQHRTRMGVHESGIPAITELLQPVGSF